LKWLLDPFALVGVYLVLVTVLLDRGGEAPGLSLACAVVPFQLLTLAVINSMSAVASRRSIVLNMGFDRSLIPLSATCTEAVAFAASLLLPASLMVAYGVGPTLALLWMPLIVAITLLLAVALAYAATLFGLYYPDLRSLGISLMRTLFFLAPGLVALSQIPGEANELVRINPLSGLFESWRSAILYGDSPEAWMLLVPAAAAILILAAAWPAYKRDQAHFAKVVG
jgi:lipopolysaccharide transport system permease protein